MSILLSVDLGLKAGLAWFTGEGRLLRCRSAHFATRGVLKKALPSIFAEVPGLTEIVLEGGGPIADVWINYIRKQGLPYRQVSAEDWRRDTLFLRERRSGLQAKNNAERLAADLMARNGITKPQAIGNDVAEAILCGFWALCQRSSSEF